MNSQYSSVVSDDDFLSPEHSHSDHLFSESVIALGRLQWFLERGDIAIHDEILENVAEENELRIIRQVLTALGREMNGDPISWWVCKVSKDLDDLRRKTQEALEAAEVFKEATKQLKHSDRDYGSYSQLLADLQRVAEIIRPNVERLTNYVQWLYSQDVKGPGILFTYRVWGTTRRSERRLDLKSSTLHDEPVGSLELLSLAVLGLWSNNLYAFDRELLYTADEFYLKTQVEQIEFSVREERVTRRVARYALEQFAEYAIFIRDSLRNIILEIDKCYAFRQTLLSDKFLRQFVEAAMNSPKQETLFWDFKRTLEMWHAKGNAKEEAKIRICEHVAAFGNARGGILIIGVTDERELMGFAPDKDLENKLASLAQAIAELITYPRSFSEIIEVPMMVENVSVSCVAIVVRECSEAVAVKKDNAYTYPVRTSTGKLYRSHDEISRSKQATKQDNFDELVFAVSQFVRESKIEI